MRPSLIPLLAQAVVYNEARQQSRVRLFEVGVCFKKDGNKVVQKEHIAGIAMGDRYPNQWGHRQNDMDFYDIKGDVMSVLSRYYEIGEIVCEPFAARTLHKGQSCAVVIAGNHIGTIGMLSPYIQKKLNIARHMFVFELELPLVNKKICDRYQTVSKYPTITRDIAIVVKEDINSDEIIRQIRNNKNVLLKSIELFDIYKGDGVESGCKSLCIRLVFQEQTKTLYETEVGDVLESIITNLKTTYNIKLR